MIPLRKRLEIEQKKCGLRLNILQQDYILSWILVGLFEHPLLKKGLIFKGGTALKKCYFGEYRFSEDLDFSVTTHCPKDELLFNAIIEACQSAEQKINAYAPIRLLVERYEEKDPHPHEQEAFKIKAQFPWEREPLTVVMVEISHQEIVLLPPVMKKIIHEYGESIDTEVVTYPLEEIVLEKFRAILQHTKKLHEKDWSRSRARDYYDLGRIFGSFEGELSFDDFVPMLRQKCAFKQVGFSGGESFFDPRMISNVLSTWEMWLGPLVPLLPPCNQVLDELKVKIESLLKSSDNEIALIIHSIAQNKLRGEALYEVIDKVIRSGIDANQGTSNGHHLLQNLIKANLDSRMKLKLVKQLVGLGAKVDTPDRSGLTPFATAVANGEKMIADFLHAKGAPKRVPTHMYPQFYNMYF